MNEKYGVEILLLQQSRTNRIMSKNNNNKLVCVPYFSNSVNILHCYCQF